MSNLLLSDDRKMAYVQQLKVKRGRGGKGVAPGTVIAMDCSDVQLTTFSIKWAGKRFFLRISVSLVMSSCPDYKL